MTARIGLYLGTTRAAVVVTGGDAPPRAASAASAAALLDGRLVVGDDATSAPTWRRADDLAARLDRPSPPSIPLWDTWFRPDHLLRELIGHLAQRVGGLPPDTPAVLVYDVTPGTTGIADAVRAAGIGPLTEAPLLEAAAWSATGPSVPPGRLLLQYVLDADAAVLGVLEARPTGWVQLATTRARLDPGLERAGRELVAATGRDPAELACVRVAGPGTGRPEARALVAAGTDWLPEDGRDPAVQIALGAARRVPAGGDDLLARLGRVTGDAAPRAGELRWELLLSTRMRLPAARPGLVRAAHDLLAGRSR